MKITIKINGRTSIISNENKSEEINTVFMKKMTVNDLILYIDRERIKIK